MPYQFVKWFEELGRTDIPVAGGKGANLGEMRNNGFPVPPGFVVVSSAYFEHLRYNKLEKKIEDVLYGLDVNNNDKLNDASDRIKTYILAGEFPENIKKEIISAYEDLSKIDGTEPFVAVRSSATAEDLPEASFAGQQKSFLNVQGAGEVVQAVKEAWASLFEPRAIFYRGEKGFNHMKVGLAAVVQKMVNSEQAGVMFTVDPVSQNRNTLVIEAAHGLGEYVVSGTVTPDSYKVNKDTVSMGSKYISKQEIMLIKDEKGNNVKVNVPEFQKEKQKLAEKYILQLAKLGIDIEKHYDFPQDIEWAVEKGEVYIVQSRPITTLKEKLDPFYAKENEEKAESRMETEKEIGIDERKTAEYAQKTKQEAELPLAKEMNKMTIATSAPSSKPVVNGLPASPGIAVGKVRIVFDMRELSKVKNGEILVTKMTTPDFVPAMKIASGIVTDEGGMTSHAAIVSRELGIPCIVGSMNATHVLVNDELVTIDANRGLVYKGKVLEGVEKESMEKKPTLATTKNVPITATKIYVNLAEADLAQKVAELPVDGIGLLRAEFMVADMKEHPLKYIEENRQSEFIDKMAEKMQKFAAAFYPRPVVYRATDFKSNEYKSLKGGEKYEKDEANPMIGFRGASRYIIQREVFEMELKAIKKVREEYKLKNLWLMIPFVRRVGELKAIKDIMHSLNIYRTKDFKLWIMVEVPSTVFLIDKFIEVGIDGVSIGSNDLTQLILGIDRDNQLLGRDFDERNEAVLKAIQTVVMQCKKQNVTVSVCGQAPSVYPEFAEKLVEFGVTSMSVNPDAFERTKGIVASAEKKVTLEMLRKMAETERK